MNDVKWRLIILGITCILLVTACGSKDATPELTPEATPVPIATATEVPAVPDNDPDPGDAAPSADPLDLGELDLTPPEVPGDCEPMPLPVLPVNAATDADWAIGASAEDAEYVIFEYSDFQCPGCSGMASVIKNFVQENSNVRLIYRHFPLSFHEFAPLTAAAAEAAGAQGKFWEMHDMLFANQSSWGTVDTEAARAKMSEYAEALGLDMKQFDNDLDNGTYTTKVQAQLEEAMALGLPGTPAFLFNGVLFPSDMGLSSQGLADFMNILNSQDELFFDAPPEMTLDVEDKYQATLKTTQGDLSVELWPEVAPTYVNNFIFLAEEQWYDGSPFFFVQDNYVAVTGDPTGSTVGYPGYVCSGEERDFHGQTGLLWMMGNAQFFITLGSDAYTNLVLAAESQGYPPAQFALIGKVTAGLDLLDDLLRSSPAQPGAPTDVLESITIVKN